MITEMKAINLYSELNSHIDIIVNVIDSNREQEAKAILDYAFGNWFEDENVCQIPIGDYLKMCLNQVGINHEMYFKDAEDEENSPIQTSSCEKHYGVVDNDGEPIEIILSPTVITRFLLTDCDERSNNKPLVYNTIEDARRDMRLKATDYIRLGFEKQIQEVIYDEGHNLVTVDSVQLADIILDYADDYIDGVEVSENEIRICYGTEAHKTIDKYCTTLNIFEVPV